VQRFSMPIILAGRDLMSCAQTGSGKTASFLVPICSNLISFGAPPPPADDGGRSGGYGYRRRKTYPKTLILAPTRELAIQIHKESKKVTFETGLKSVCVYGGADIRCALRSGLLSPNTPFLVLG
jgi:ATP-dependent RNA helicase DDX3X